MIKILKALSRVNCRFHRMDDVAEIISAALAAADPSIAIQRNLFVQNQQLIAGTANLPAIDGQKIITIAIGKAAPAMMRSVIACLGDRYQGGVCVCKHMDENYVKVTNTKYLIGNHPVPGEGSLQAGKATKDAVRGLSVEDIVLLLVSGGGSSLVTLPVKGISLADLQIVTSTLLRSGANITELNAVRKHLDLIKGGGLLRLAAPARVAALVLSDVVGNNLEVIASGPASPDPSTYADALRVLSEAAKLGPVPASITRHLTLGAVGQKPETIKVDDLEASLGFNTVIASNQDSCTAAGKKARELGFSAQVISDKLVGEARMAGDHVIGQVMKMKAIHHPFLLVWGGETTVTVTGNGKGGRNLELALAAVKEMAGLENTLLLTLATDGEDGPTDAAGAIVTGETFDRAMAQGLNPDDFLQNNDAYTFFARLGDLVITDSTGTNVNDLTFVFGL